MNHHGKDRFCRHGSHMAPTESFRVLPGVKSKREICQRCYDIIMQARERLKEGR